ncbi:MAG: hypothetical protein OXU67_12385 [Chloroflexota bacterium]|nr:hypothetical protein [Chloroflexota bacterium]
MATRNGEYFRHGLILGVLVGLLAALLVAPSSGRQLRARLAAHFGGLPPGAGSPTTPATGDNTTQSRTL